MITLPFDLRPARIKALFSCALATGSSYLRSDKFPPEKFIGAFSLLF